MKNGFLAVSRGMVKSVKKATEEHAPEILAGCGIVGFVTTIVCAVKATSKSKDDIEEAKQDKFERGENDELDFKEKVRLCWKNYIPTAITASTSIACIIGSVATANRRTAIFATAYKIAEETAVEYRNKVIETIGEKKEEKIRTKIEEEHVKKDITSGICTIVQTGKGKTLCKDMYTGIMFYSDIEHVRRATVKVIEQIGKKGYCSVGEYLTFLGIDSTYYPEFSYKVGWNRAKGIPDFHFDSVLVNDEFDQCFCIYTNYHPIPEYCFNPNDWQYPEDFR